MIGLVTDGPWLPMMRRSVILTLAIALAFAVAPVQANDDSWPVGRAAASAERAASAYINEARAGCSVQAIIVYPKYRALRRLARWRARDMAERGYFSHTVLGSDRRAWDYLDRFGITAWDRAAEIIAWTGYSDELAPGAAVKLWADSESHNAVLLDARYTVFAVGSYKRADGRKYFVVIFLGV